MKPTEEERLYAIRIWIKIDPAANPETMTYDEAEAELKHLEMLHPDNKYEIEEYEND